MKIEYHYKIIPLLEHIDESGDLAFIKKIDNKCYIALIDGLGHGKSANHAASLAIEYLEENYNNDLSVSIKEMHNKLKGSRGVVIALCCVDMDSGQLVFTGIGNITTRILGIDSFRFVPQDGILGYNIPTPLIQTRKLIKGDILILYSDGIKENFDILNTPGLLNEPANVITETLFDKYSKKNDDSSMIILKVLYD